MSAGVSDQRMKGQGNQVSNGSKEQIGAGEGAAGSEEFEPWRTQQQNSAAHPAYGASVPISSATDIYNMSTAGYYGSGGTYPYQAYGDGTWSNGTDVTFLSSYPQDYSMDGMFGPSTTFSTAAFQAGHPSSFNYFPNHSNGGDYNTWGNQLGGQQQQQRKYDDYYRDPQQNIYPQALPQDNSLKAVEHAMQNLELKSSSDSKDLGQQQKKATWASIASQPAKPQLPVQSQGLKKKGPGMPPGPIVPGKHNIDIGTWESNKSTPPQIPLPIMTSAPPPLPPQPKTTMPPVLGGGQMRPGWAGPPPPQPPALQSLQVAHQQQPPPPRGPPMPPAFQQPPTMMPPTHLSSQMQPPTTLAQGMMPAPVHQMIISNAQTASLPASHPVLDELKVKNNYNPTEFDLSAPNARFFVIKSYSEDDIHRSIKYEIWCSTEHGNKRLDQAYREREGNGCVHLFFSVNGSGHFCGMAQMVSAVDYNSNSSVWSQDKWKGQFKVRWIYVKDVPNVQLRHIRLENNENKPVTNSRDAQEIPHARGLQVLRIMHSFRHSTSIFDDFIHYEKRQEEEDTRKVPPHKEALGHHQPEGGHPPPNNRNDHQQQQHRGGGGEHHHHRGGGRNHHQDHREGGDRNNEDRHRGGHRSDRGDREGHHGGGGGHHHRERGGRGGRGGGGGGGGRN